MNRTRTLRTAVCLLAIFDAVGVRLEGPPFTAEKVYLAMLDAGIVK